MRNLIIISFLSALGFGCHQKQELSAIAANNKGVKMLKAESWSGAQQNFMEALSLEPFEPVFHNNLGVSLEASKETEKAIKSYGFAEEKALEDQVKFTARFNLAQGIAKQGKTDEALVWYQKALDINPSSAETKTNIELLTKQQKSGGEGQGKNKDDKSKDKKPDDKNDKDNKDKDGKDKKEQPKEYENNKKFQPRPFKGELSESDVKKILGELKQQEQKIRADYNRKDAKEQARDKDW